MALSDYNSSINYAREEGMKEGRAEVLELFEQGLSVDEIKKRFNDN